MMFRFSFGLLFLLPPLLWAQDDKKKDDEPVNIDELFRIDAPITVELEQEEFERVEPKKKKPKRNWFLGIKTKKGFTKTGFVTTWFLNYFIT